MKEKMKAARRLDNVEFQAVTPERVTGKENVAFTTPKHTGSRPNSGMGFSTPSIGGGFQTPSSSGQMAAAAPSGGFATPVIGGEKAPKKFRTPKQTDAQLDRVLKNRNINQKKVKKTTKKHLLTPKNTKKRKMSKSKESDMVIPENILENSSIAADEEVENYFQN